MVFTISPPSWLNEQGQHRSYSEDYIYPAPGKADAGDRIFMVCDGVGGAARGDQASRAVCKYFTDYVIERQPDFKEEDYQYPRQLDFLNDALHYTEEKLDELIAENPDFRGMATTLTFLNLSKFGAVIAWAGDSRVYHLRNGQVLFRTEDHSLVNQLVKTGQIEPEEAATHPRKNVILRAVSGTEHPSRLDLELIPLPQLRAGDIFFLCSDGILEAMEESKLVQLLSSGKPLGDIKEIIDQEAGKYSRDNYSMYLIRLEAVNPAAIAITPRKKERQERPAIVVPLAQNRKSVQIKETTDEIAEPVIPASAKRKPFSILWVIVLIALLGAGGWWLYLHYFSGQSISAQLVEIRTQLQTAYDRKGPAVYERYQFLDSVKKAFNNGKIIAVDSSQYPVTLDSIFSNWTAEMEKADHEKKELEVELIKNYNSYKDYYYGLQQLEKLNATTDPSWNIFTERLEGLKLVIEQGCVLHGSPSLIPCQVILSGTDALSPEASGLDYYHIDRSAAPWNEFEEIVFLGYERFKVRKLGSNLWGVYNSDQKELFPADDTDRSFLEIFPFNEDGIAKIERKDGEAYISIEENLNFLVKNPAYFKHVDDYFGYPCKNFATVQLKNGQTRYVNKEGILFKDKPACETR